MGMPRNCRHCAHMVCGDANWCGEHEECMSDAQISCFRGCSDWAWHPMDALTFEEWAEPPAKVRDDGGQMEIVLECDEVRAWAETPPLG